MIHSTAIIDPAARLDDNVSVGPYSVVGADVEIGAGTVIGPHVVLKGPTRIGRNNRIFQFASVGEDPQDLKYDGEPTRLEIGDGNTIRECATINRGTETGGGVTRIGSHNLFMAYIHIAHDCTIGDHVVFANSASLAGHVTIGDYVILAGFSLVHQFCSIGEHAFVGLNSVVNQDVAPYLLVVGNYATARGINKNGLRRRGFSDTSLAALHTAFRGLIRKRGDLDSALAVLPDAVLDVPEVQKMVRFIRKSERGIIR